MVATTQTSLIPTGQVNFYINATSGSLGTLLGHATLDTSGDATFSTSALAVGSDTITAIYNFYGIGNFASSTSATASQTVTDTPFPTTTTLTAAAANPSTPNYGQSLSYDCRGDDANHADPSGHVFFYMNATGSSLGPTSALPPWMQRRRDLLDLSLALGTDTITAIYNFYSSATSLPAPAPRCANRRSVRDDDHANGRAGQSQLSYWSTRVL